MIGPELHQRTIEEGIIVLEAVGLVHNQRGPGKAPEELLVFEQNLIGGKESIELELVVGMPNLMLTDLHVKRV